MAEIIEPKEVVCGPTCHFRGKARQGDAMGGLSTEVSVDLSTLPPYVAGGIELDPFRSFGMKAVNMADVLASTDPWCEKVEPCGYAFCFDTEICDRPKLLIFTPDGEVDDGFVGPECCVWFRLYGIG